MLRTLKALLALAVYAAAALLLVPLGLCLLIALAVGYWHEPDLMEIDA